MQPTMKLRWVKRKVQNLRPEFNASCGIPMEKVLQQWWEQPPLTPLGIPQPTGKWIDIPIEVES